jgi:hypothetical protein
MANPGVEVARFGAKWRTAARNSALAAAEKDTSICFCCCSFFFRRRVGVFALG